MASSSSDEKKYHLLCFDSNGPIDRHGEVYQQKIFQVLEEAQRQIHLRAVDLMVGKPALNTVGRGFCDAFALYFIYHNIINASASVQEIKDCVDAWTSSFDTDKSRRVRQMLAIMRETMTRKKNRADPR